MGKRFRHFARRLVGSESGNAMLVMTAGVIPVVAAVAGGVDMTRAYMADNRLQQAVDAAALAGRKVLSNTNIDAGSPADLEVQKFLNANFPPGTYNSTISPTSTRKLSLSIDGNFCVNATAQIPTLMMGGVKFKDSGGVKTIAVGSTSCARRSGSNIDVVFVLDVTGSMAAMAGTTSRIDGLKAATKDFLDTLDATRTQLANVGLRVRVGFVPYNMTVNIGRLLVADTPYVSGAPYVTWGPQTACNSATAIVNCQWTNVAWPPELDSNNKWRNPTATNTTSPNCKLSGNRAIYVLASPTHCTTLVAPDKHQNPDLTNFASDAGAPGTAYESGYKWRGCVEARPTVTTITGSTSTASIPAGAYDILDLAPGATNSAGTAPAWRPYFAMPSSSNPYGPPGGVAPAAGTANEPWNQIPWRVKSKNGATWTPNDSAAASWSASSFGDESGPNQNCPAESKRLTEQTKAQLTSYIDSLKPLGSTLHDTGMYWGLAMISASAPFVNATKYIASGYGTTPAAEVKKYIIFMTDGAMDPSESGYSAWGIENYQQRLGTTGTSDNRTTAHHNTRFLMICEAAKQQGVNISTVSFGLAATTQLKTCASTTDQSYTATTSADLITIFKQIANNIGYLRVSK